MKIHEYQSKALLASYGVPVPEQRIASTPDEAYQAARMLGRRCIVKAQVHSGGRGKAGGVRFAENAEKAGEIAQSLLGTRLITAQSGPLGNPVEKVLVTECVDVAREYYLAVAFDAERACPVIIASAEGGVEIEALAQGCPERIHRIPVPLEIGYREHMGYEAARLMGLKSTLRPMFVSILSGMVRLFIEKDCSLIEINPLAQTREDTLIALDAKIGFDDNALFLHPELESLRDAGQEDPNEARANEAGLSYVALSGSIGCLVNGAGLAMATMDMIKSFGAEPANFLDVGGSATAEKVATAFSLLLADSKVKVILVNIFGGIMKCNVIADGIVEAAKRTKIAIPLVVRLQGTHLQEGRRILAQSGIEIITADGFAEAVENAVAAAKGGARA